MPKLVLCVALAALAALAGSPEAAAQEPSAAEQLDAVFVDYEGEHTPGMAVAIVLRGKVIHANGFGMANLEQGTENTPETIFRIGSTSKQFTALCIAMLHLRGELDLDADIREYLPEMPDFGEVVTVRNLVHHTSGIPDYPNLHVAEGVPLTNHVTAEETYERLTQLTELEFPPGSQHSYSNSGYFLMGQIVHRVSGQTLREFAHENIFAPLGMDSTHYHDRHDEIVPGRADGYSPDEDQSWVWRKHNTQWDHVGDGGVFTTVLDMAKWNANFDDNQLEGGQELMELVHTVGVLDDGTELTYAFGLNIGELSGQRIVGHAGGWVGFRAESIRLPELQLSVIVFSNCASANPSLLAQRTLRKLL